MGAHASPHAGYVRRHVDKRTGYTEYRGRVLWNHKEHSVSVGVRGATTARQQALNERASAAECRRRLDAKIVVLGAGFSPNPPPIPMDLPGGREFVRRNDPVFRRWIYRRDRGLCGICGEPVAFDEMHVDHIRPRIDGGNDHVANFRITHGPCNLRRGAHRQRSVRV